MLSPLQKGVIFQRRVRGIIARLLTGVAGSDEVKELQTENDFLKMLVAELTLWNRTLKKTLQGLESGSIDT